MAIPTDTAEVLRIVERLRIELLHTRSVLRNCLEDAEMGNDVSAMISRLTDAVTEAELLIAKLRNKKPWVPV